MADLPFLLAGPIVRRVDPSEVCVWLAVSRAPSGPALVVFNGSGVPLSGDPEHTITRLGERLYLVMLRLRGLELARAPAVYPYQVVVPYAGSNKPYNSDDDLQLRLKGATRPSFILPGLVKQVGLSGPRRLRIAQASCRKMHGGGPDALAILARALDDNDNEKLRELRPQQLYLTGDQIYADDVTEEVLVHIGNLAPQLFGWREDLATAEEYKTASTAYFKLSDKIREALGVAELVVHCTPQSALHNGNTDRHEFLQSIGFKNVTAYSAEHHYYTHHLMSFQEWCVMYLLSWSGALWADFKPIRHEPSNGANLDAIELYRNALPNVRRVLANVATYMIFDDHDVTDDWFMKNHRELLLASKPPIARRIVRNGLLAYMLFQDWGNQPDDYSDETGLGRMAFHATEYLGGNKTPLGFTPQWLDQNHYELSGLGPAEGRRRKHYHYDYCDPDADFTVIVLDSRTMRGNFMAGNKNTGEALLTRDALDLQLKRLGDEDSAARTTILIAPAPLAGFDIVDTMQKVEMARHNVNKQVLSEPSDMALDNEGWGTNAACLYELIRRFAQKGIRPIVLSGDVHYAYSEWAARRTDAKGDEIAYGVAGPRELLQLCCSSAKNSEGLTRFLSLTDLVTYQGTKDILKGDFDDIGAATALAGLIKDLKLDLREDDEIRSQLVLVGHLLDTVGKQASQFVSDPGHYVSEEFKNLLTYYKERTEEMAASTINSRLRPYVLTRALMKLLFGDEGASALTGTPVDLRSALTTEPIIDDRKGAQRYKQDEWSALDDKTRVPKTTADWYAAYTPEQDLPGLKVLRNRSQFLAFLNFLSVGDSNVGIVDIGKNAQGQTVVAHSILWALPDEAHAMPLYVGSGAAPYPKAEAGVPAWGVTLHKAIFP